MRFEEASYQAMLCADKNGYTGREIKIYELDDEWIYLIFPSEEITKECPRISINRESGEITHGIINTPKLDRLPGTALIVKHIRTGLLSKRKKSAMNIFQKRRPR